MNGRNRLSGLLLSLSLLISSSVQTSAATGESSHPSSGKPGWPAVTLLAVPDYGYFVNYPGQPSQVAPTLRLVSINGKDLSRLDEQHIADLLKGPEGSTIDLELMNNDLALSRVSLIRMNKNASGSGLSSEQLFKDLQELDACFARQSASLSSNSSLDRIGSSKKDLLLVKAVSAVKTQLANELVDDAVVPDGNAILADLVLAQATGNLQQADQSLSKFIQASGSQSQQIDLDLAANAILNMVALERINDADRLAATVLAVICRNYPREEERAKVLEAIDKIPPEKRSPALKLNLETYFSKLAGHNLQIPELRFMADNGDVDKAIAQIQPRSNYAAILLKSGKVDFRQAHAQALLLFELGRWQAYLGNKTGAESAFKTILSLYEAAMTPAQMATLDKVPLCFPTAADTRDALGELGRGETVIKRGRESLSAEQLHLSFPTVVTFRAALQAGNGTMAGQTVSALIEKYRGESVDISHSPKSDLERTRYHRTTILPRQDLFATIVESCRQLTDGGFVSASDQALNELLQVLPAKCAPAECGPRSALVLAELAYNSRRSSNKPDEKVVDRFYQNLNFLSNKNSIDLNSSGSASGANDFPLSYRLRLLSRLYFYSQKYDRALFFLSWAKQVEKPMTLGEAAATLPDWYNPECEHRTLSIGEAAAKAASGDFSAEDKLFAEYKEPLGDIDDSLAANLIDLLNQNNGQGERMRIAGKFIDSLTADLWEKLASKSALDYNNQTADRRNRQRDALAALWWQLAYSQWKSNNAVSAVKYAKSIVGLKGERVAPRELWLCAKTSEAAGSYNDAALYYYGLTSRPFLNFGQKIVFARSALQNAEKATGLSKKELADIYLLVANTSGATPEERRSCLDRAYKLMPDTDPKKAPLAAKLARADQALTQEKRLSGAAASTDDALSMALKAAELAELNKLSDAWKYWLELAILEARAKQTAQAYLHAEKALMRFKPGKDNSIAAEMRNIFIVAAALRSAGAPEKAEQLINDGSERICSVCGACGIAAQMYWSMGFEYSVDHRLDTMASKYLDRILAADTKRVEYKSQERVDFNDIRHMVPVFRPTSHLEILQKLKASAASPVIAPATAVSLFEKILNHERLIYLPDDQRFAITYRCLAEAFERDRNYKDAEKTYLEYLAIASKYDSRKQALHSIRGEYASVLRSLGRAEEAAKILNAQ